MTEAELRAAILARIQKVLSDVRGTDPQLWTMMYAVALDDIAELVDPTPVDTPPSHV